MKVKLTFIEEMLGTKASDPAIYDKFMASKAPTEVERKEENDIAEAQVINEEHSGSTIFHRVDGVPSLYNYMIKGFFKEACSSWNRFDKEFRNDLDPLKAFKTKIDGCIFIGPRILGISIPAGQEMGVCQRPLRGQTAQGPRISLARSETVPAGSTIEFEVRILSKELKPYIVEWFNYGKFRGLGQWRNSSKGSFTWELLA